jgi:hypothetical protein
LGAAFWIHSSNASTCFWISRTDRAVDKLGELLGRSTFQKNRLAGADQLPVLNAGTTPRSPYPDFPCLDGPSSPNPAGSAHDIEFPEPDNAHNNDQSIPETLTQENDWCCKTKLGFGSVPNLALRGKARLEKPLVGAFDDVYEAIVDLEDSPR